MCYSIIKKNIITSFFLITIGFCFGLAQTTFADNTKQANEFLNAYEALSKGRFYGSDHLKGYILHPYLEHERLKKHLKKTNNNALIDFINRNRNNWLGSDINTELLQRLAKQKQWGNVLKFYQRGQGGVKAKCVGLEAQLRTRPSQKLQNEALILWKSSNSRPKVCDPLFSLLKQKGLLTDQIAWERVTLAMNKGKTSLARSISKNLLEPSLVSLWVNLRKNPSKHLSNKRLRKNDARSRQLIAYGIKRIARKDTNSASYEWQQAQRKYTFSPQRKAEVESYIAVRDAKDHKSQALNQFARIPAKLRSDDANLWMARLALRQGDWRKLRAAIGSMTTSERNKDRWRYWQAHSSKRLGDKNIRPQLQVIAKSASFYGFLAADELKVPYARLLQQERNWSALTPRIKNIKAIQRATELYSLGLPKLAKKDWNWAMKKLSKDDQLIAAAYALEINQPFLAIITVSGTKDWNQTGLRFPLEYQNLVKKSARANGVVPAWVYGIMRRESAFDPIIKSSANARGLMQVLPSTAKGVAKSLGIRHKTSDLYVPERNANIGAAYMSQMLKRFKGNYAKATASYNAGPHRIPRWLPKQMISAPRWIESIPFDETRNYVRAVMSYTTIYDHKLHYKNRSNLRLSQRLQAIGPK
ncbi:MAG: transglycosylase SLT domain-containing protein [Cocleimonas sp.]